MEKRPQKTKVTRKGKSFTIKFSEKDGKALAAHVNAGGSLGDVLKKQGA
jgi:hypothetical protein